MRAAADKYQKCSRSDGKPMNLPDTKKFVKVGAY